MSEKKVIYRIKRERAYSCQQVGDILDILLTLPKEKRDKIVFEALRNAYEHKIIE